MSATDRNPILQRVILYDSILPSSDQMVKETFHSVDPINVRDVAFFVSPNCVQVHVHP
jgi:hypothetical protein